MCREIKFSFFRFLLIERVAVLIVLTDQCKSAPRLSAAFQTYNFKLKLIHIEVYQTIVSCNSQGDENSSRKQAILFRRWVRHVLGHAPSSGSGKHSALGDRLQSWASEVLRYFAVQFKKLLPSILTMKIVHLWAMPIEITYPKSNSTNIKCKNVIFSAYKKIKITASAQL